MFYSVCKHNNHVDGQYWDVRTSDGKYDEQGIIRYDVVLWICRMLEQLGYVKR